MFILWIKEKKLQGAYNFGDLTEKSKHFFF